MKKKLLFSILFAFLILSVNSSPAFAQGQSCNVVADGGTGGLYTTCTTSADCDDTTAPVCLIGDVSGQGACVTAQSCAQGVALNAQAQSALRNFAGGNSQSYVDPNSLFGASNDTIQVFFYGGQSSGMTQVMNFTYALYREPPANTQKYIAYMSQKMNIPSPVKDAYAQTSGGVGFASLGAIIRLWEVSRNIALVGFAILLVIIGIMIMLRKQIDARTVVTVQQALPKIAVALVLVLFSYPLYGLLIDAVTLITRLGAWSMQSAGLIALTGGTDAMDPNLALDNLLSANIFALWDQLYNVDNLFTGLTYVQGLENSFNLIAGVLGFTLTGGGFGSSILRTVVFIAMFVSLLRTFFLLLTSYLMVTLRIIFSPFQFFMMALPGSGQTLGSWVRGILAHLMVFPTVFFMLALAAVFASQGPNDPIFGYNNPTYNHPTDIPLVNTDIGAGKPNLWRTGEQLYPPGAPRWAAPGLGDWGAATGGLLALGIVLTVPKAGTIVREAVQYKGSQAEGAAGEALQRAAGRVPIVGSLTKF